MKHSPDNPQSTSRKVRTARMNDEEYNYITSRHNGLSAAIRLLTKGGKYEQAIIENEELISKLKELQK